jgi:hypothetical protein
MSTAPRETDLVVQRAERPYGPENVQACRAARTMPPPTSDTAVSAQTAPVQ